MIGSDSVLAIIPARGGSKGVPGKNVHLVGGRALIEWTILAAQSSRHVDRIVLSSDDEEIIAVARRAGCDVPFRRSADLSSDEASSIDVLVDALERVPGFDVVVLLQPTSPLRTADDIDGALQLLVDTNAESCVSVTAANQHPYLMFERNSEGILSEFCSVPSEASLRRQDLPAAFVLNGAVYAARVNWVQAHLRLVVAGSTVSYVMPHERSLDVDTWADIYKANDMLHLRQSSLAAK